MSPHDPPDVTLILNGKRVPVPSKRAIREDSPAQAAPSKTKSSANKKRPHKNVVESDSDNAAEEFLTKKQKRKEKLAALSSMVTAAENHVSQNHKISNIVSDSPPSSPTTGYDAVKAQKPKTTAQKHIHRLEFSGRPNVNCAADHPSLRASDSLAWTFLILTDPEHDDAANLVSGTITCAFCVEERRGTPRTWAGWHKKKSGGSTGNAEDNIIINPSAAKCTEPRGGTNQ